jgi:pilus assembly protein CpaC
MRESRWPRLPATFWVGLLLTVTATTVRPDVATGQPMAPVEGLAFTGDVVKIVAPKSAVEVAERFSKTIEFSQPIQRVDGFDPTVLGVTALNDRQIRLQALEQGVTTVVIHGADQQSTYSVEVFVTGDARLLQSVLKRTYPNTAVTATKVRDAVMLRGWVSEPQQISEIVELAKLYFPTVLNQMKVGGPQEVQLRVKVMEVQRSLIRRFGINFAAVGRNAAVVATPGPAVPLSTFSLPFGGPPGVELASNQLSNASMALGIATDDFVFQGLVQALKQEGLLKINAEPVLITRSGEAAKLVNGGEFPIPVPQSLGLVTIEWREFGVLLESLPIVLGPTTIKQQITAEVSERDFTNAVTVSGTTVPGLTKRTVQTNVVMEFGQTLVIGGLISTRYSAQTDKVPFLGELPGIGAAFRRVRYDTAETELLVMITPEYVSPLSSEQIPPGGPGLFSTFPTDRELYHDGAIEVPNYGDQCEGCQPNQASGPMAAPTPSSISMPSSNMMPTTSPVAPPTWSTPATGDSLPPTPTAEPGLILPPNPASTLPSASAAEGDLTQRGARQGRSSNPVYRDSAVSPAGFQNSASGTRTPSTAPPRGNVPLKR